MPRSTRAVLIGAMLADADSRGYAVAEIHAEAARLGGNATHTARALGASLATLHRWARTYPDVRAALEAARSGE